MALALPASTRVKRGGLPRRKYPDGSAGGRVAVLTSGGLDSTVLIAESARVYSSVYPVYIRAGMIWERNEIRALGRLLTALRLKTVRRLAVLPLPMDDLMGGHWSVTGRKIPGYHAALSSNYIPGRNLTLIAKAAVFCALNRIGEIALATLRSNPFPDAQPRFFDALADAITLGVGFKVKVHAPYLGMTKAELIRRMGSFPFELTVSCIRPRGLVHCGTCTKCAERIEAFHQAGVQDPTRYAKRAG